MQPRNIPQQLPPSEGEITAAERRGAAAAHAAGLLVGVPLFLLGLVMPQFGLPLAFAYIPSPILAYLIARSFRRRQVAWGSFQGMQATIVQLIILFLIFPTAFEGTEHFLPIIIPVVMVLFLYTLWAAWDTLFGEDFRYIGINRLLRHVANVNMQRQEQRRRFGQPYSVDRQDRDDERRS